MTTKLKELDTAKSNFFANISHEFRTPLTLIKTPVEAMLNGELQEKERSQFESILHNSERLLSLVNQLLDLSRLEAGSWKLAVEEQYLNSFLEASSASFEYVAEQRNVTYKRDFKCQNAKQFFDRDVVEKIVVNLLSNAFKYTSDYGQVSCSLECSDHEAIISVCNTGADIDPKELTRIFQRFYQTDSMKDGVGVGLALVKELTSLHHGTLDVTSKHGETIFQVRIPTNKGAYKDEFKAEQTTHRGGVVLDNIEDFSDIEDPKSFTDHPMLLIVEDNPEMRQLVIDLFENSYNILEAKNGKEGLEKAAHYVPDIIISDVMMPGKNGVELAERLKQDERTSHIPIILLTAKAGEDNIILGLETGADDYIVKPFNHEVLQVRVKKLIETRAELRARYRQEVVLRPKDIAVNSADEKFLERLQILMDDRLTDTDFSAATCSKELGMSRMQLHRKLKALVNLSTSEFIRSQRLKLAASLLENAKINMSEVGYAVGFNDPSYFTKCFKEAYGHTPKQYASLNKLRA